MGIEQRMEFDFTAGEKLDIAKQYNIVASPENLAKLKKIDDTWYFGEVTVQEWDDLYSGKDTSY